MLVHFMPLLFAGNDPTSPQAFFEIVVYVNYALFGFHACDDDDVGVIFFHLHFFVYF